MRHKKETFKGKSKLPSSSNWGEVLLSRLRVNPGLFLSADLSSFVPHKWTHLIDFLSTWITSIAVNMGRQIPLLPSRWGLRRMGAAAGEAQHNGGCGTLLTAPCAFPWDSAELPESWHSPQGPGVAGAGWAPSAYWEAWGLQSWHTGPSQPFLWWEDNSTDPQTHPPPAAACSLISCVSCHSSSVTPHPKPWPLGAFHPSPDLLDEQVRHMPTSGP